MFFLCAVVRIKGINKERKFILVKWREKKIMDWGNTRLVKTQNFKRKKK